MDIKKYILDGEYMRGNLEHPEKVIEWLRSKGVKCNAEYDICNDPKVLYFVIRSEDEIDYSCITSNPDYLLAKLIMDNCKEVKPNVERFDPETFKPFDKVLVRMTTSGYWSPSILSFTSFIKDRNPYENPYRGQFHTVSLMGPYVYCIPYNEDTAHLTRTENDPPEYYRYWEDYNENTEN